MQLFTDGSALLVGERRRGRPASPRRRSPTRIAKILPDDLEAKTGDQVRDDDTEGIANALSFINYILLGFGIVALLVGTFIIYNTFSMIVAQRQRELALLRAIGADAQAGAPLGRVRGAGHRPARQRARAGRRHRPGLRTARAARCLRPRAAVGRPRPVAPARSIIIDRCSAPSSRCWPRSRRLAARHGSPPVAAMREEFATPGVAGPAPAHDHRPSCSPRSVRWPRSPASTAKSAGSALRTHRPRPGRRCARRRCCCRRSSRGGSSSRSGGWSAARSAPVGRLARTNAVRNPRRTAATAFALTLGLVLVAGIAVIGVVGEGEHRTSMSTPR